jgi:signal transduction histidine kinase
LTPSGGAGFKDQPVERDYHREAMPSHWLAVEAETDPLTRARELQRSWERLLADGVLGLELPPGATAGLRPAIVESWRRSLATGLDPTDLLAPIEADESEVLERWFEHPLGSLTHVLTEQLRKVAEETRSMVVVTDASGLVLHRVGDEWLKERAAEMNLVEGARYSEAVDGTNGIGTALAADHAFQVFAFEHFNQRHHQWMCCGAPVHDPVSGRTIGLIDLSSLWKIAHPRSLELVTAAARTIEQRLLQVRRDQDARLRRRYGDLMTRSMDLLVNRDGYVLAGAERGHSKPLDVPEGGAEVVLDDGSVAVAEPLGQGEAYLLRRLASRTARSAPVEVLERAEEHVRELVTEQAALRRVATLVARESPPDHLFAVVAEQVARVFDVPHVRLVRYEPEGSVVVGGFSEDDDGPFPIGSHWPVDSPGVTATVRQTGRPARVEDYAHMTGEIAAAVRGAGMRSAVASPIAVARRLWGAMVVLYARDEPLPPDTEARLTDFTELVATAIANAESRAAVARLADEQAALRRVATMVAQGVSPQDLFEAVAVEVGRLLPVSSSVMGRFEPDGSVITVASWSIDEAAFPTGERWPTEGTNVAWMVLQTGRAARIDDFSAATDPIGIATREAGITSAVGSPIVVEGRLWGVVTAASTEGPLPKGTEARLASFTDLVATAIANAESHSALEQLADEQAALRRVATLIAQGARPATIFSAVGQEVGRLFGSSITTVARFEPEGYAVLVDVGTGIEGIPIGDRWELDDLVALAEVFRTGRSVRVDEVDWSAVRGPLATIARRLRVASTVASPIFVEGRVWGVVSVSDDKRLPPEAEERLEKFSELIATAIANAESSAELTASRRRIVTAADEARRRIERNLHDGTQQRLIALGLDLRRLGGTIRADPSAQAGIERTVRDLESILEDLRELSHGLHPPLLSRVGLRTALRALARRSPIPVQLDVDLSERPPTSVETAIYYVVSEAIANAIKHSHASAMTVTISSDRKTATVYATVADDGVGGAEPSGGSGLIGLGDRVDALGGRFVVESPAGLGTRISVELPVEPPVAS